MCPALLWKARPISTLHRRQEQREISGSAKVGLAHLVLIVRVLSYVIMIKAGLEHSG